MSSVTDPKVFYPSGFIGVGPMYNLDFVLYWSEPDPNPDDILLVRFDKHGASDPDTIVEGTDSPIAFDKTDFEAAYQFYIDNC